MLNNIAFEVGLATSDAGAAFGIMPWQKKHAEKKFLPFLNLCFGLFQTYPHMELVSRATPFIANKAMLALYSLVHLVAIVPLFFGVIPDNKCIKKYAVVLQKIQQIVGLALSMVIAVKGSTAYGLTSAAWITLGLINERKHFSRNTNTLLIGAVGITSVAVGIISKIPDHKIGAVIAVVAALAQFQWVKSFSWKEQFQ